LGGKGIKMEVKVIKYLVARKRNKVGGGGEGVK